MAYYRFLRCLKLFVVISVRVLSFSRVPSVTPSQFDTARSGRKRTLVACQFVSAVIQPLQSTRIPLAMPAVVRRTKWYHI
ncbi:hypothetical protein B0H17DRAFT_1048235 [Mycena rosella]|uniref:Secreted protein n=1 Tax=Mycena rosella TaxID=1033263 RepID=A0AAD7DVB7_MYCRO|nr:hypothetical protein B0H17DRAFT_1048235 [Mycena rosella]